MALYSSQRWLLGSILLCLLSLSPALAQKTVEQAIVAQETGADPLRGTSLKFVPADASFYYSRLRMKAQYDAFVNSVGWTKFLEMPAIQMARHFINNPPEIPELGEDGIPEFDFQKFWEDPENKELANLLWELVSDEAFVYGDAGFADTYETLQKASMVMNRTDAIGDPKATDEVLAILAKWKIPNAVIGFKVKDPKRAEGQLARLEKLIRDQLAMDEKLAEVNKRFTRTKIGGSEFLAIQLDGSLVPWEEIQEEAEEENKEQLKKIHDYFKKLTIAVHMGVHDGYLLLAIGPTDEHVRKLGQGPLLMDKPELAPLKKFAPEPFTNIGFLSERFLKSANDTDAQVENYMQAAEKILPESGLDEEIQRELLIDIRDLGADFKKWAPKPGNYLGFGFMTPRGTQGYAYDWSEQKSYDGSQRMSILDHLGGKPLFFTAARAKYDPELYEVRVKWLGRAVHWAEHFGLPLAEPEQAAFYERIRDDLKPLFERLDLAIKTMWIPSFKDGQSAWVVDAKTTSAKWFEGMPAPKKPLPFLEFATVSGVSDAPLLKRAAGEFHEIAQLGANALNAHFPDFIEKTEIPAPKTREFPEGTIYYYPAPEEAGADPQFAPNAGLSKDTLALSLVPKFSLRLLKPTPLEIKEGPLAIADKPLAHAMYFDFAGFVDTWGAWIDYGFEQSEAAGLEDLGVDEETLKSTKEQLGETLEFLKCLRSISSVSYLENGALVTHSEWNFVDRK